MQSDNATYNQYLTCKFERYKTIRNISKDFVSFKLNLKQIRRENQVMKHNVFLGSTNPCKCVNCNPDTSNIDTFGWFKEEYNKAKDSPEFKKEIIELAKEQNA